MKESEFYELLVKFSGAISKKDMHVDMLRVLYTDLSNSKTELEQAKSAFELFHLLIGPGILKATDISVLFETIELTGFRYLKEIIKEYETYPKEVKITRFSAHRQHVVALGRGFSFKDVQKLCQLYRGGVNFPNQWKLMEDLETDVLTEEKMSTFLQCLKENEVNKDFNQLLLELSEAISKTDEKYVDMLRVLYTDHAIIKTDLENAKSAFELFQLLIVAGILNATDISVLFETIELTGLRYLKKIIETYEAYPDEMEITRFSQHRQHLVALGKDFLMKGLQRVHQLYEIPDTISTNPWKVITFLENEGILSEGHLSSFLMNLKPVDSEGASTSKRQMADNGSGKESTSKRQKLEKGCGNASESKRQMSDQDEIIRDFLNERQKQLYRDVKWMTPTIWPEDHEIDIADVFTELRLMQSKKEDKASKGNRTSVIKEGRSASLNEVLDIITSKDSCKVLISGKGGMGKTTLLRYIAYQWATDGKYNAFASKLLFLINIRDIKANESFFDIITKKIDLKELIFENDLPSNSVEAFLFRHADKIVLLLDGYDELEKGAKDPIDLFEGNELRKCTVLMSSRPDSIVKLVKCCDVHTRVEGFNTENIKKYIIKHFNSIGKRQMGCLLYFEFIRIKGLSDPHKAIELWSSPLLLLRIITIWETKQCIPSSFSSLFKELFCATLNQFLNRGGDKNLISEFDRIPEEYTDAIQILGECMYESLKENKLSIDRYVLSEIATDKKLVCLALELGFVYKDSHVLPGDVKETYTTPHKLISEALAGFYLYKQIQKGSLNPDEYEVIRCNNFLYMTRVFTIGFLGADAWKLLRHWLIIRASNYRSIAQCLRHVNKDYEESVIQELDKYLSSEMKAHCEQMCESLKSILVDKVVTNVHLFKLMNTNNSISVEKAFLYKMDASNEESLRNSCRDIVNKLFLLPNVCLTEHFLKHISNWGEKEINILSAEMEYLDLSYNLTRITLDFKCNSPFLIHLLKHAKNLTEFHVIDKLPSSTITVVIDQLYKAHVMLKLTKLNLSKYNLVAISGRTLARLCKISTHLIHIDVSYCSLSGRIINEMMEECCRMNVALKDNMLSLEGNDLSDIDGQSLAKLVGVIKYSDQAVDTFKWNNYSLTASNVEKLVDSVGENGTLNITRIDLSNINLSSIHGRTLAHLCKVCYAYLIHVDMNHCELSGGIINEMMEQCHRMNVVLNDNMFSLEGNNLSDIDSQSLVKLVCCKSEVRWRDYSLTTNNLEKLVNSMDESETLNWKRIDMESINLSAINGRTLACLFKISPHLSNINMSHCSLSGSMINEMMEECCIMNVVLRDGMLCLKGNDLSDINVKSLAKLVSLIDLSRGSNYFDQKLGITIRWRDYSLTAYNLEKLVESMGENEILNWKRIDMACVNLSAISGRTLACLFKISPHLINIDMSRCNLSSSIIYEMMEECRLMNVVLKDDMLSLKWNNLSDIDGKSLAKLVGCNCKVRWQEYSLTATNLEKLVESMGENEILNWKRINMAFVNLSAISGRTLACLFKISPHLINIDMSHCNLSGSIIYEMMEECHLMNVVLKDDMLSLKWNNLSDIDGKSLAKLVGCNCEVGWQEYSLTAANLEKLVESMGENEILNWKRIDMGYINLSDISGRTLACLFKISPHLTHINMSYCSLSGSIINEMMEECHKTHVMLKLSRLDISCNNLVSVSGKALACLWNISTQLTYINMSHCCLSGSIINEMLEECRRMNVMLKCNMLNLEGNDHLDIEFH